MLEATTSFRAWKTTFLASSAQFQAYYLRDRIRAEANASMTAQETTPTSNDARDVLSFAEHERKLMLLATQRLQHTTATMATRYLLSAIAPALRVDLNETDGPYALWSALEAKCVGGDLLGLLQSLVDLELRYPTATATRAFLQAFDVRSAAFLDALLALDESTTTDVDTYRCRVMAKLQCVFLGHALSPGLATAFPAWQRAIGGWQYAELKQRLVEHGESLPVFAAFPPRRRAAPDSAIDTKDTAIDTKDTWMEEAPKRDDAPPRMSKSTSLLPTSVLVQATSVAACHYCTVMQHTTHNCPLLKKDFAANAVRATFAVPYMATCSYCLAPSPHRESSCPHLAKDLTRRCVRPAFQLPLGQSWPDTGCDVNLVRDRARAPMELVYARHNKDMHCAYCNTNDHRLHGCGTLRLAMLQRSVRKGFVVPQGLWCRYCVSFGRFEGHAEAHCRWLVEHVHTGVPISRQCLPLRLVLPTLPTPECSYCGHQSHKVEQCTMLQFDVVASSVRPDFCIPASVGCSYCVLHQNLRQHPLDACYRLREHQAARQVHPRFAVRSSKGLLMGSTEPRDTIERLATYSVEAPSKRSKYGP
ncbi:hypothetical protein SDRG_15223 [Saprolegnia diclina VS20]|uniref:Uncharacterized protein n=1 Tax=Saprolegnia diclina (strain VS20) TaxID=1156394 RepID=T0PNN4_SAPDV|nr:hypothetical protein SDRG_15223 [Saprolegnia diclina VS20]EQC27009.1 hypothetical protein SDRG_15223 [Saprolegnia diclina VS20]|eukprot:XP_008619611.1 hypothetical protein SDRG_15223 [Saprolegnia diclina VS20]